MELYDLWSKIYSVFIDISSYASKIINFMFTDIDMKFATIAPIEVLLGVGIGGFLIYTISKWALPFV